MILYTNERLDYMKMSPVCDEEQDHKGMVGRCPVCGRLVASNMPDEKIDPQIKSLKNSEDLRKILP